MEFNSFVGSIMEKAGATCVDCHMPKAQSDDGTMYSVHIFKGPDCNEELYENCLGCHTDSTVEQRKAAVEEVKADYETRRRRPKLRWTSLHRLLSVPGLLGRTHRR